MGTEPRCQQLRGTGGRGRPGGRAAAVPSAHWDETLALRAGVWERARSELWPASRSVSRSSVNGPYQRRRTRSLDVCGRRARRCHLLRRTRPERSPWGAQGVWGPGAGSVGENAPRPPAFPPPARGEAEGRRDRRTNPQQDRGWAIPWGPVTHTCSQTHTQHSYQPKDTHVALDTLHSRPCTHGHGPQAGHRWGA